MSKVRDTEVEIPVTEVGGSGPTPPPGHLKPNTPRGSNVEELTSELKVLKLKKKLKSKKTKIQEVSSSSSSNDEGNGSSSSDESFRDKKGNGKKKNGAKSSYNTTSFNYDSLPSNHFFTSVHIGKPPCFDGVNYAKWCHGMKVHLMSLNPSV
jgi:hypothetical protein